MFHVPTISKTYISRSSTVGTFAKAEDFRVAPTPAYKVSKAALNMLTVQYAQQYETEGFTVLAVSPGVSCRKMIPLVPTNFNKVVAHRSRLISGGFAR